jgi:propane 2-monooxygenase small subunit
VERLKTIVDWGETIVAVNVCFEPLCGVLIQRELGMRAASANGDSVTPVLGRVAQLEWDWVSTWTTSLMQQVLGDANYAEANREQVRAWIDDWLPRSFAAAQALAGMVDELPVEIDFEASWSRTLAQAQGFWDAAGVAGMTTVPA